MPETYFEPGPFTFTKKLAVVGGQTAPGDWAIKCNGHAVGRVHQRVSNNTGIWEWYCWLSPARNGTALSEKSALEAVKADVLRREIDGMIDFNYPPSGSAPRRAMEGRAR